MPLCHLRVGSAFPEKIPSNIRYVVLFKFAADKGGGSWKLVLHPVNVEDLQSLRHVQPVCEFTAPDTRNNMSAAMFHDGNLCKEDMEDVLHRRSVLLHLTLGEHSEVAIVKNINSRHHRTRPDPLPEEYRVHPYEPNPQEEERQATKLDDRIALVDFKLVQTILLMLNTKRNELDKIEFRDQNDKCLASLTLKKPIPSESPPTNQPRLDHYLLAGLFTGDLDFLSHFFGHQGASA